MRVCHESAPVNAFQRFDSPDSLAHATAKLIVEVVKAKPNIVLCLPTGRTPTMTYRHLVRAYNQGDVSFANVTIFNVDEYLGLGRDDLGSFAHYMRCNLFDHIDAAPNRVHIPDGKAADPIAEASSYEQKINDAGGIDLLVLGVGTNGHIGFNEPGSRLESRTRVVELTPCTLKANQDDLPKGSMPHQAITIGISTILEARQILLMASGASKRKALAQLCQGGPLSDWPIVALRQHDNTTVLFDTAADPRSPH